MNKGKFQKLFFYGSAFIFIVGLLFFVNSFVSTKNHQADAASGQILQGYAWSSNIGWISFNESCAGCQVTENGSGYLTGYAWSSNIGWVQFGGLGGSGFPSGAGTTASEAQHTGNSIVGWTRAVAAIGRTDGWDGWISLNGINVSGTAGPVANSKMLSGYAWGADVVGWVDMSQVYITNDVPPSEKALNVSGATGCAAGSGSVNVSWTISTNPTSITILRSGTVIISGLDGTLRSYLDTGGTSGASYTYVVRTFNSAGISTDSDPSSSIVFPTALNCAPPIPIIGSFKAIPPAVLPGGQCQLTWSGIQNVTNTNGGNCTITGPGFNYSVPFVGGTITNGSSPTPPINATSRYTLNCSNNGGSAQPVTATCSLKPKFKEF